MLILLLLVDDAASSVASTISAAEEDAANIEASTTNLINFEQDTAVAEGAVETIGLPAIAGGVATGVFLIVLAAFLIYHHEEPCTPNTVTDCAVGCSVTNFGDTSFTTNCFTTLCATTAGCSAVGSTVTTETTTALCPVSRTAATIWVPASGQPLPFLGTDLVWTTPTGLAKRATVDAPVITGPPTLTKKP
ncbi:hypothetical protein F5884DRAFT_815011 [Xylogone sp. PMI_703]|nr:hypothetical protein F5884DRAFT_815011 [Xylogone sp. PMI_703]